MRSFLGAVADLAGKIPAKTIGLALGLALGAAASTAIVFLPAPNTEMPEETYEAPVEAAAKPIRAPASRPNRPPQAQGSSYGGDYIAPTPREAESINADMSSGLTDFSVASTGSSLPPVSGFFREDLKNDGSGERDSRPSSDSSSSSDGTSSNSPSYFAGGTGGITSTATSTSTTTSFSRYLSSATADSSVYSGSAFTSLGTFSMIRSDTGAVDLNWSDEISLAAFTDSTCSTVAGGTLSVASNPVTMALGAAVFSNIVYTTSGAQVEETIYLKASADTAGVSLCVGPTYVKQKFNSGSGYVRFQHGGTGASGRAVGSKSDIPQAAALDSQNRLVVAGMSLNVAGRYELAVWRYTAAGSLDTTFGGGDGFLTFQPAGNGAAGALNANKFDSMWGANPIAIDSQDRIILAGASRNAAGTYELALWRFESDGDLDTTFNGQGYLTYNPGGNGIAGAVNASKYDEASDIVIDSAGRYVVSGDSTNAAGGYGPVIVRYLDDGTLDPTFGTGGVLVIGDGTAGFGGLTNATKVDWAHSLKATSDGGYLLGGAASVLAGSAGYVSILWKVTSAGALDTSFGGGDGYIIHDEGGVGMYASAAYTSRTDSVVDHVVDSSGRIIFLSYGSTSAGYYEVGMARYSATGTLDTTFGTSGASVLWHAGASLAGTDPTKKYDNPSLIALDSSEKILVSAAASNNSWGKEPIIARLTANGALDTSFSGDGILTYSQNNAASLGGATAAVKRDGYVRPTIDGTQSNFTGQLPLVIDGGGRYVLPMALSIGAHPLTELGIMRFKTDGTLDQ